LRPFHRIVAQQIAIKMKSQMPINALHHPTTKPDFRHFFILLIFNCVYFPARYPINIVNLIRLRLIQISYNCDKQHNLFYNDKNKQKLNLIFNYF